MREFEGTSEAIILVKASPQVGKKHGETVCCAGVSDEGDWLRLYPVSFRTLNQASQFRRWDRVRFRWRKPLDDHRPESLRVDHQSIEIVGELKPRERLNFLSKLERSGPWKRVNVAPQVQAAAAAAPNPSAFLCANSRNVVGLTLNNRCVERSTCDSIPPFSRSSTCLSRASAISRGMPWAIKACRRWIRDTATYRTVCPLSSINKIRTEGKTLALLRPRDLKFSIEKKSSADLKEEKEKFRLLAAQADMFNMKPLIRYDPCPYTFKYSYTTDDGEREGTCQDWETDATFYNWSRQYGEQAALQKMKQVFGEDYPKKGMVFAMGTHSQYPDTWLINGIIRLDEIKQFQLL